MPPINPDSDDPDIDDDLDPPTEAKLPKDSPQDMEHVPGPDLPEGSDGRK